MDWKIEVLTVPVADVDRARAYYAEKLNFAVDLDVNFPDGTRLVQLTPPGSGCSIHLNTGITSMPPGSLDGLLIVVDDVVAAKAELDARDVEASPVQHLEDGEWLDGKGGDWNSFIHFKDPDGNSWALQERPASS
jgi:catechol 2,3-dioxygenase-like lactoylglutathione lyase family enzyme